MRRSYAAQSPLNDRESPRLRPADRIVLCGRRPPGFSPIAVILESRDDVKIFWDMVLRIRKCTDKDSEYRMAIKISDWISNEAHL